MPALVRLLEVLVCNGFLSSDQHALARWSGFRVCEAGSGGIVDVCVFVSAFGRFGVWKIQFRTPGLALLDGGEGLPFVFGRCASCVYDRIPCS